MPSYRFSLESLQPQIRMITDFTAVKDLWIACEKYHDNLDSKASKHPNYEHDFVEWVKHISEDPYLLVVAEVDGIIVGFACANYDAASEWGNVIRLFVMEKYRREGIATKLMVQLIQKLKANLHHGVEIGLTVMAGNEDALRFYASLGFELQGYLMKLH